MRNFLVCNVILFVLLSVPIPVFGQQSRIPMQEDARDTQQQQQEVSATAEDRVAAFLASGDIQNLALYTLQVVELYREQRSALVEQTELVRELMLGRQRVLADLLEIKDYLVEEREARDALAAQVLSLETPLYKALFNGGTQGGAMGAAIGKDGVSVLVGSIVGLGIT